jgi:purine-binding chemotaxis protein CheW
MIPDDDPDFADGEATKKTRRILCFSLGEEYYGVDLRSVKEVIRLCSVTRVPNTPPFVSGVFNLRGEIISLLDLRHLLGLKTSEKKQDSRIVITDISGEPIGILVDRIESTLEIEETVIQPPLATLEGSAAGTIDGQVQWGSRILVLLNFEKILSCDEINRLKAGGK